MASVRRSDLTRAFPRDSARADALGAAIDALGEGTEQHDGTLGEAELDTALRQARLGASLEADLEALFGADAGARLRDAKGFAEAVATELGVQSITVPELTKDLEVLTQDPILHVREAGAPDYAKSAAWAAQQLADAGVEPSGDRVDGERTFFQGFRWEERYAEGVTSQSANVVGVLPGQGPEPREAVLVIAHLDNLSRAEKEWYQREQGRDLSTYEGANDNAAAVAAALEVARALKEAGPQARDVIFLLPSAEEDGLKGTEAFVMNPPVPLDRIVGAVNLEMIGANDLDELVLYGGPTTGIALENPLYRRAMEVAARSGVTLKPGPENDDQQGWYRRSDHYVTAQAGIPSLMFHGRAAPDTYHTASDTLENLNLPKVERVAEQVVRVVRDLANDPNARERRGPPSQELNHYPGQVWPDGDR
jgi:hypothetical protein